MHGLRKIDCFLAFRNYYSGSNHMENNYFYNKINDFQGNVENSIF